MSALSAFLEMPPTLAHERFWHDGRPLDTEEVAQGIYICPRFMQEELNLDPAKIFEDLCALPRHPSDKPIELDPTNPCLIEGDHAALRYRGHAIRRHKIWAQENVDRGCIRYGYTGWQWNIALATKDVKSVPFIRQVRDAMWPGLEHPHNQWIATLYKDGNDSIGFHHDKVRDIDESSWIVVLKLGAPRRFEFKDATGVVWSRVLEAGTAVWMNGEGNELLQHGVPPEPGVGPSGSIVGRCITTLVPWMRVMEEVGKRKRKT